MKVYNTYSVQSDSTFVLSYSLYL